MLTLVHGYIMILLVNEIHALKGKEIMMTNTKLLEEKIVKSGFKKKALAQKLSLTPYGLQLKVEGKNEFKASEIYLLCELLGIETGQMEQIFFTKISE